MVIEIEVYMKESVDIWDQEYTAKALDYNFECSGKDCSRLINHTKAICLVAITESMTTIPDAIEFKIKHIK